MFAALAVLAAAGMPAQSAAPVAACTCGGWGSVDQAREALTNYFDFVIIGAIADSPSSQVNIEVQTVFKGILVQQIALDQSTELVGTDAPNYMGRVDAMGPDCSYTVLGEPGERYFLTLTPSTRVPGTYSASGCASFAMRYIENGEVSNVYLTAARSLPGGGGRPETSGDSDVSLPLAAAGLALPIVFLLAAAFVWRRWWQA